MSHDPNDVVKVFSGTLIEVESNQQLLADAGIECKVVGTELTGSFGTAMPSSIELWVHRRDAEKAATAIKRHDEGRHASHEARHAPPEAGHGPHGGKHPHPTSDPKPGPPPVRKEPYINPNPGG